MFVRACVWRVCFCAFVCVCMCVRVLMLVCVSVFVYVRVSGSLCVRLSACVDGTADALGIKGEVEWVE